ncbi:MAG: hypothetical protein P8179_13680 [Candidatus Thiodiazotropha sp.]
MWWYRARVAAAHGIIKRIQTTGSYRAYIELDVHKESIAHAVAHTQKTGQI